MTAVNTYIGDVMKKILAVVIIIISLMPLYSIQRNNEYFLEDVNVGLSSHLYGETVMLYGYPAFGGTWDIGITVDSVNIDFYLRYDHLFRLLGSPTGKLSIAEEKCEEGLSFKVRIYERGPFPIPSFFINYLI